MSDFRITQNRQKASAKLYSIFLQGVREKRILSKTKLTQEIVSNYGIGIIQAEDLVIFMSKNLYTIEGDIMNPIISDEE